MDAKTRRLLKAKQGKVDTGSGSLAESEGYEGQVQVRDTSDGPMLFAKLKGKWTRTPLAIGGDFFIPKAFTADVILPDGQGKPFFVVPHFIPLRDILNISVIAVLPGISSTLYTQLPASDQTLADASGWFLTVKRETREVFLTQVFGALWANKEARLTILYK